MAVRLLHACGWRLDLPPLPADKLVLVFYPHTSNWDFPLGLLARFGSGWPVSWVGKHTLFRWPLHKLMVRLGGIPVDRGAAGDFVERMADEFARRDQLVLAISPEGTRRHVDGLKSGFHRIARRAGVPVALGYIDYGSRTLGIADVITVSDDPDSDLERMRQAYAGRRGKHPALAGEFRFRRR
ncbi:MAG: 1-acyl-sn-glycerol-3-phosphate acyltransferase [Rhodocyclaceae bacterium]|nr:1-acyl-sn-glycerol-3-phosphate acyltransferase [Rhodocyclaceae bacterium]